MLICVRFVDLSYMLDFLVISGKKYKKAKWEEDIKYRHRYQEWSVLWYELGKKTIMATDRFNSHYFHLIESFRHKGIISTQGSTNSCG